MPLIAYIALNGAFDSIALSGAFDSIALNGIVCTDRLTDRIDIFKKISADTGISLTIMNLW